MSKCYKCGARTNGDNLICDDCRESDFTEEEPPMTPTPVPSSPDLQREAQEKYPIKGEDIVDYCLKVYSENDVVGLKRAAFIAAATPLQAQLTIAREALQQIVKHSDEHPAVQSIAVEALKKLV